MLITRPTETITDHLQMLGVAEYPVFCFQDGGERALFEGSVSAVAPVIGRQIESLGIDKHSVQQLVVTHAHPDHVMGIHRLRELFPHVNVLASEIAAKTLAVEKAVAFFCKIDQALAASLKAAGSITDADRPKPPAEMRIPVDRTLKDGDPITVGGAAFRVLATPGHSDCSLSFHEPKQRILIVSDATGYYMPADNTWWPNYFTSYGAYLDSIQRLAGLEAEVLCLSHNAVVKGADEIAAYFKDVLAATEAYHQRILNEFKGGKSVRELAEQLGAEVHAKTRLLPLDFFQKNCALLVKLSLQHAGIYPEPAA